MVVKYLQTKSTGITYGINSSSTTIQLKKLLKLDGTAISASDIGDLLYGTFAPGTSREEIFSIIGSDVTVETDGKVTIINVIRGLKEVEPYTTGGYACDHPAGEVVVFGNNPQVYQYLRDYIDNAVIAGGVDASSTLKGLVKLSIDPDISTEPVAVGDNDPRIPTTDQTDAMDGTQGIPNATNKFVTSDNVSTGEADQSQTTQNGTVEFGEANSTTKKNIICQSFTPLKTKIRGIKLYKTANTGTFTGDVTVELFADSAGSPTGSALATGTLTNAAYNALPVGEFDVLFASEYSMTAGSTYWFKVSASTADSSNHPNLGTNTAGGYANGSVKYYNGTDGYVPVSTIDLYFKTLQGVINQISLYPNPPTIQVLTSSGTYTKSSNLKWAVIEVVGSGGYGGNPGGSGGGGGGGGGGGYAKKIYKNSQLPNSISYTISSGTVTFINPITGNLIGNPGANGSNGSGTSGGAGGAGGSSSGGDLNIAGSYGGSGINNSGTDSMNGVGGSSFLGFGGNGQGLNGTGYGGGAGGSGGTPSGAVVIITEYF